MSQRHEKLISGAAALLMAACSGTRQVETTPKADVLILTSSYAIQENLGSAPVEIISNENIARYRLERKNKAPEFLLVLFPNKVNGPIPVKLSETDGIADTAVDGSYFDQLLRAHRLVLKGDLERAEKLLERIQAQYDDGYGTTILAGTIALLNGHNDDAVRQFRYAKSMIPDAPVPQDLAPSVEGEAP